MMRHLSTLAVSLVLCGSAHATFTVVQHKATGVDTGNGYTGTAGCVTATPNMSCTISATASGDKLRVWYATSGPSCTISDGSSDSFSSVYDATTGSPDFWWHGYWIASATAGTTTVTATCGANTVGSMVIAETSGDGPEDVAGGLVQNGSSTTPDTGGLATTVASDVVFGHLFFSPGFNLVTINAVATWTLIDSFSNANARIDIAVAYQVESSTGTYTPPFTLGTAETSKGRTTATQLSGGGGGGGGGVPRRRGKIW